MYTFIAPSKQNDRHTTS